MSNIDNDTDDLPLEISVGGLLENFTCPICYNSITECYMTECGHNFCKVCLFECLNRKHCCPFCNKETTKDKAIKNLQLDQTLAHIIAQREIASKKYFENLIAESIKMTQKPTTTSATTTTTAPASSSFAASSMTPIEEVLQKHLPKLLFSFQDYYKDIKTKFDKHAEIIKVKYSQQMALSSHNGQAQVAQLQENCKKELEESDKEFQQATKLLVEAYDKYLQEVKPIAYFPVSVTLTIASKKIQIPSLSISTSDTLTQLRQKVEKRLEELKNPLQAPLSSTNIFTLKRKFAPEEAIILSDENKPLVQYRIDPASEILLLGDVKLLSDKPKQCFSQTFTKGDQMDYFTCKTCSFNWICEVCADSCHKAKGHVVVNYLKDHKPTWACCYCTKNKKCSLSH